MESKEDIIHSHGFSTLESYTVFRRRAPSIANTANLVLAQTTKMKNWHFKLVLNSPKTRPKYWIVLCGSVNNSLVKTSLVTDITNNLVKTENSFYRTDGPMSAKCSPHRLFDQGLLQKFKHGFPANWRALLEEEISRIEEMEDILRKNGEGSESFVQEEVLGPPDIEYEHRSDQDEKSPGRGGRMHKRPEGMDVDCRSSQGSGKRQKRIYRKKLLDQEKKLFERKAVEILGLGSDEASASHEDPSPGVEKNGSHFKSEALDHPKKNKRASILKKHRSKNFVMKLRVKGSGEEGLPEDQVSVERGSPERLTLRRGRKKRVSFKSEEAEVIGSPQRQTGLEEGVVQGFIDSQRPARDEALPMKERVSLELEGESPEGPKAMAPQDFVEKTASPEKIVKRPRGRPRSVPFKEGQAERAANPEQIVKRPRGRPKGSKSRTSHSAVFEAKKSPGRRRRRITMPPELRPRKEEL